ncbi:hypothetical protein LEP1GSC037_1488 [Leptospira interrogans str. 2006001854]|uniref:Uncharacterized protein n=1 Tax=Leptospira interrogans str. 2006001854 TaxID=1001590 RepID=M6GI42_LEPIR|nr:hypothetical protein LEP1GSC037_1488 [Leptospira interrogans str. 2006001854]
MNLKFVGTLTKLDFRVEFKICGNSYEVSKNRLCKKECEKGFFLEFICYIEINV